MVLVTKMLKKSALLVHFHRLQQARSRHVEHHQMVLKRLLQRSQSFLQLAVEQVQVVLPHYALLLEICGPTLAHSHSLDRELHHLSLTINFPMHIEALATLHLALALAKMVLPYITPPFTILRATILTRY